MKPSKRKSGLKKAFKTRNEAFEKGTVVLKRLSRPEMEPLKKEKSSSTKAFKTRNEE